jgi:peptidyl-prolyl cis-trans isomerase D
MLDALRRGAGGWLAQILIAGLVLSFAVWGVSDVFTGFRADMVASVGSSDISIAEFQRQLDLAVRQFNQQYGQQLTVDQARGTQIPNDVLGRLVSDATLNDAAHRLGLGISNQTLAQQIVADPTFHGTTGNFDKAYFTQVLRSAGLTEDAYMAELRASYIRQQISDALSGGTLAPDAYLRALHEYQSEERKISYVVLTPTLVGDVGDPSDGALKAYFDAHKADYRAPEYRALSILRMAPTDLAKPDEVSDEDAKKAYDAALATTFTKPELRKVEQIVFKDKADADAAVASLAAGKTFDDLVGERKLKPADVDLGTIARDKIIDPAVAEAAFGLAATGVSGIVDGRFGPVMVRVSSIEPAKVTSFDDAKADVKKTVATQRAAAEIADQRDVVVDARAGGSTLAEVGKKYGLDLIAIAAVDKTGADEKGQPIKDLPGGPALVTAAFASDVGTDNEPIAIEGGFVWFDVTAVTAEHDRELADVRDKAIAAWKRDQVDTKLAAKAGEVRDRIAKGEDIAKIAAEMSLEVKTADKVTRATPPAGDLTASVRGQAFAGPKGSAAVGDGAADQSKVVLVVTDAEVPPYFSGAPDLAQSTQQLSGQIGTDFMEQYVVQLQSQLGVKLNQTALQQALGTPGT